MPVSFSYRNGLSGTKPMIFFAATGFVDIDSCNHDASGCRFDNAAHHADRCGFSCAVRPDESINFPCRYPQAQIVSNQRCSVILGQFFEFNHYFAEITSSFYFTHDAPVDPAAGCLPPRTSRIWVTSAGIWLNTASAVIHCPISKVPGMIIKTAVKITNCSFKSGPALLQTEAKRRLKPHAHAVASSCFLKPPVHWAPTRLVFGYFYKPRIRFYAFCRKGNHLLIPFLPWRLYLWMVALHQGEEFQKVLEKTAFSPPVAFSIGMTPGDGQQILMKFLTAAVEHQT